MKFQRLFNKFGLYSIEQMSESYADGMREKGMEMQQVIENIREMSTRTYKEEERRHREELDDAVAEFRERISVKESEIDRLKKENKELKDQNKMLSDAVDEGAVKLADSEAECERLRDNLSTAASSLADKRVDIANLKDELNDATEALEKYKERAGFLEADRDNWQAEAERLKAKLDAAAVAKPAKKTRRERTE